MDDYIPSGNFFTPKRPSFRFTGPGHQYSRYVSQVNHGQHQNHNHRRGVLHGASLIPGRMYYSDARLGIGGRGDPNLPIYFQTQPHHFYPNQHHQYQQQTLYPRYAHTLRGQPFNGQGSSSQTSLGQTPSTGRFNANKKGTSLASRDDDTERESNVANEATGVAQTECNNNTAENKNGRSTPAATTSMTNTPRDRTSSLSETRSNESTDCSRKKRPCPTQIPMHALQYADEMAQWHALSPVQMEEIQMRILASQMQSANVSNVSCPPIQEYHEHENSPPPETPQPPPQEVQQAPIIVIPVVEVPPHPEAPNDAVLHTFLENRGFVATEQQRNFLVAARAGFEQFNIDYCSKEPHAPLEIPELPTIRTAVDEFQFYDTRCVDNYTCGEREYRVFEDGNNSVGHIMRDVYNMNEMDCYDTQEICGVKILPKTLQTWPLEAIGSDWGAVKKHIVNFTGGFGSCGVAPLESGKNSNGSAHSDALEYGEVGAYGVRALANLFATYQGVREYPLTLIKFVGVNVDKLVKDLDSCKPILPSFAGPLADRNHLIEVAHSDVFGGFPEYELPWAADPQTKEEAFKWVTDLRIKELKMKEFGLETLLYIFYTIPGDALQMLAAKHIYARGWRYHKSFNVWITPWVPGMVLNDAGYSDNTEKWDSGSYKYFHYGKWAFFKGEFKVNDCVVEGVPAVVDMPLWENY